MSMYKGPYVFEFVGAFVRWAFLMLFKNERTKKDLFKKILTGQTDLAQRSWDTFIPNFLVGIATVIIAILVILYFSLSR